MVDVVADYWWVPIFTVPLLAVAIKLAAERSGLVDNLPGPLRAKLSSSDYSFPKHWVVTATLRDGRRFSRVVIDSRFRLVSRDALPFRLRDVEDVAWEGFVVPPLSPTVQLSGGQPGAGVDAI